MNDFIFDSGDTTPDTRSMVEQLQDALLPEEAKAVAAMAEAVSESQEKDMSAGVYIYSDDDVVITIGIHKATGLSESPEGSEDHF